MVKSSKAFRATPNTCDVDLLRTKEKTNLIIFRFLNFQNWTFPLLLTLRATCISESCAEIKVNLNVYFRTSVWCLKRCCGASKPFEAPQKSVNIKAFIKPFETTQRNLNFKNL